MTVTKANVFTIEKRDEKPYRHACGKWVVTHCFLGAPVWTSAGHITKREALERVRIYVGAITIGLRTPYGLRSLIEALSRMEDEQ